MNRRNFVHSLLSLSGLVSIPALARTQQTRRHRLLLQQVPLAGFQYYEGERLFSRLQTGDDLQLRRAPENPYDERAIEVYWQGHMLGHVPRIANTTISQMLDRGERIMANIAHLRRSPDPWQRIEMQMFWEG